MIYTFFPEKLETLDNLFQALYQVFIVIMQLILTCKCRLRNRAETPPFFMRVPISLRLRYFKKQGFQKVHSSYKVALCFL